MTFINLEKHALLGATLSAAVALAATPTPIYMEANPSASSDAAVFATFTPDEMSAAFWVKFDKLPSVGSASGLFGCTADKDGRVIYTFKENELSVGKFEVTQAQWQAVMRTTQKELSEAARPGGKEFGIGPDLPVYDVSAEQAKEFCARLNKSLPSSFRYRFTLPDEAEWEYACRAGTTTELNNGRDLRARNNVSNALNEVAW